MSFTREENLRHWREEAERLRDPGAASWTDRMAVELEIRELDRHLSAGQRVLDVGCANGFTTMRLARENAIDISGVDPVPELIELARARSERESTGSTVSFTVGDITALEQPAGAYDRVIVVRVLINLAGEDQQRQALGECARVLRPGGLLLLSEATVQGWERLNALRREWGLDDVPVPAFNRYLDQDRVPELAPPDLALREVVNFASTYYLGTRLIKPLMIRTLGLPMDPADPEAEWNRLCAQLPAVGDYGIQKLFVFVKR